MAPIQPREGYAFVPRIRGEAVSAELLDIADDLGEDRQAGVRTVTGGYHVLQAIADKYNADHGIESEEGEQAGTGEQTGGETFEREYPEGTPEGSWTVKNLEAWAGAQDPKVELGDGNKAEKLKVALDSLKAAE